jgi:DNA-binding LacI/PurR family transcriptional regulator
MEELGYRPHVLARGLAGRHTRILALLFPTPERGMNDTEMDFVMSAQEAARRKGYNLLLWTSDVQDPDELSRMINQGLVDGLVVMEVRKNDRRIDLLKELKMPFSLIGRADNGQDVSYTDIDFKTTMESAFDYLINLGHKRIAFLDQSKKSYEEGYGPCLRAYQEYRACAEARGIAPLSRFAEPTLDGGFTATKDIFSEDPSVSSIISINDRAVPGILRYTSTKGLSVPNDLSLLQISNARTAEISIPSLSTMEIQSRELARRGVEYLIERIENPQLKVEQTLVPCPLVIRQSTGPNRKA